MSDRKQAGKARGDVGWWLAAAVLVLLTPVAILSFPCFALAPAFHFTLALSLGLQRHGLRSGQEGRAFLLVVFSHFLFLPLSVATISLFGESRLAFVAGFGLAALLEAVVLAPVSLFVPAHLHAARDRLGHLDGRARWNLPSIESALAQWEAVSTRQRVLLPLMRAVPVAAAVVVFTLAEPRVGAWAWAFASWVYGIGLVAYVDRLSATFAETRVRAGETLPVPKRLFGMAALGALLAALVCGYGAVSSTQPTPMRASGNTGGDAPRAVQPIARTVTSGPLAERSLRVPNTDVTLRAEAGGDVVVETADGGGAGRVPFRSPFGPPTHDNRFQVDAPPPDTLKVFQAGDGFQVEVRHRGRLATFDMDRRGVRLDDGLIKRLEHGIGSIALAVFVVGLLLLMAAFWLMGPGVRLARQLGEIANVKELEEGARQGALTGKLRGSSLKVEAGRLQGEGAVHAHLQGGMLRLRIPPEGVRCEGGAALSEDMNVTLVGEFERLAAGHRDAEVPWPKDALLLLGDKKAVAQSMLRSKLRPARMALFFASTAELAALVIVWVHRA